MFILIMTESEMNEFWLVAAVLIMSFPRKHYTYSSTNGEKAKKSTEWKGTTPHDMATGLRPSRY
jgi:hypothetical protein